jgi:hypothetical protein
VARVRSGHASGLSQLRELPMREERRSPVRIQGDVQPARARAPPMKRHMLIAAIFFFAICQAGCASRGPTRAVLTPWGGMAIHSFRPPASRGADGKAVNAEIARLLDEQDASGTFVAAR